MRPVYPVLSLATLFRIGTAFCLVPCFKGNAGITRGAGSRVRTDDLLITNQLLYQLSYAGLC
jgi:hypothetical protein